MSTTTGARTNATVAVDNDDLRFNARAFPLLPQDLSVRDYLPSTCWPMNRSRRSMGAGERCRRGRSSGAIEPAGFHSTPPDPWLGASRAIGSMT